MEKFCKSIAGIARAVVIGARGSGVILLRVEVLG